MNSSADFDATPIIPKLWQGSIPTPGRSLRDRGFGFLVLCASEWQPPRTWYDIEVIRVPFDDKELDTEMWSAAMRGADAVAGGLWAGKNVLTTCVAGLNRSGLVNALAMMKVTGCSGAWAVKRIQSARPLALDNQSFVDAILKIKEMK